MVSGKPLTVVDPQSVIFDTVVFQEVIHILIERDPLTVPRVIHRIGRGFCPKNGVVRKHNGNRSFQQSRADQSPFFVEGNDQIVAVEGKCRARFAGGRRSKKADIAIGILVAIPRVEEAFSAAPDYEKLQAARPAIYFVSSS